jgi:hypothetical protein
MSNAQFARANPNKVGNIWNSDHGLADEGNYYVLCNPTAGTPIAMTSSVVDDAATASSTHAQAAPLMLIQAKGNAGDNSAKSIYPKYLRLTQIIANQAWTSATNVQFSLRGDNVARYTSGGSNLGAGANINLGSSNVSGATIYFGALVAALPSANARLLGRGQIQGTIPLPGDQWLFTFGDVVGPTNLLGASAIKNITIPCGPCIIGPGCNLALDIWATGLAAAPQFEFEFGYAER